MTSRDPDALARVESLVSEARMSALLLRSVVDASGMELSSYREIVTLEEADQIVHLSYQLALLMRRLHESIEDLSSPVSGFAEQRGPQHGE